MALLTMCCHRFDLWMEGHIALVEKLAHWYSPSLHVVAAAVVAVAVAVAVAVDSGDVAAVAIDVVAVAIALSVHQPLWKTLLH